jgi:hypothetical protein
MYSGVSSVPRISLGSRSRLEETRRGKHEIANESKKQIKRKTHSRMVRFFGGVLSSLMGCFPLSAMTLGFSLLERGRRCEVMEEYASGFAGHLRGLFY